MSDFIFKPAANPQGDFSGSTEARGVQQGDTVPLAGGIYEIYVKVETGFTVATQSSDLTEVFVNYGTATATGVNTPAFAGTAASGQTTEGPFVLLNSDGSASGANLTLNFSSPAPGNNSGFGINVIGNGDGAAGFNGTLFSSVFTGDSYYAGAAYTLEHVISGLTPGAAYQVQLIASRDASDSRETRYDFSNGETGTIQTTADPTATPLVINTVADGAGLITITQSAVSGSWSYLGGLRVTAS